MATARDPTRSMSFCEPQLRGRWLASIAVTFVNCRLSGFSATWGSFSVPHHCALVSA